MKRLLELPTPLLGRSHRRPRCAQRAGGSAPASTRLWCAGVVFWSIKRSMAFTLECLNSGDVLARSYSNELRPAWSCTRVFLKAASYTHGGQGRAARLTWIHTANKTFTALTPVDEACVSSISWFTLLAFCGRSSATIVVPVLWIP